MHSGGRRTCVWGMAGSVLLGLDFAGTGAALGQAKRPQPVNRPAARWDVGRSTARVLGVSADCNANGVDDELDIAGATSADCNTNAVPDECDTASDRPLTLDDPEYLNSDAHADSKSDIGPQLATDGAGTWIAVWNALAFVGDVVSDIWFARSTDGGVTWSAPAKLNTGAATNSANTVKQIATDALGNWIVVWASNDEDLGGDANGDYDILYVRSVDNGATWSMPAALNSNASTDSGEDHYPQIISDGAGRWAAIWRSTDTLGGTIGTDLDILLATSADNGMTWSAPAALNSNASTDSGADDGPQLAVDSSGNWIAVWRSSDTLGGTIGTDLDILYARSTDFGATWTAPSALNNTANTDSGADFEPQIWTNRAGTWIAVWTSFENIGGLIGPDSDILMARSVNNGQTWTAPSALNSNAHTDIGFDGKAHLSTDGAGNWIAVWLSTENLGGTIGTDFDLLFARSTDNGQTWSAPAVLNSNADTDIGYDDDPLIRTDGAGTWIAAWWSDEDLGGTIGIDEDILLTRISMTPASADENSNGVPDECEHDCNLNAVSDELDIASGTSADCNTNGAPDECEPQIMVSCAPAVDDGETVTLNPGGGDGNPVEGALVSFTNLSGTNGASILIEEVGTNAFPNACGANGLDRTLVIDTSIPNGAFLMTVSLPITGADLPVGVTDPCGVGADPDLINLMWYEVATGCWVLAAEGNTQNSPGKPGPRGDRTCDDNALLSAEVGDYGVFWNGSAGFVWANIDHTSTFAAGVVPCVGAPNDCDCDGDVDNRDSDGFVSCVGGPTKQPPAIAAPGCACLGTYDADANGRIDLRDFADFAQAYAAANP